MTDEPFDPFAYEPEKLAPELRWKGEGPPPAYWWVTHNGETTKGAVLQVHRESSTTSCEPTYTVTFEKDGDTRMIEISRIKLTPYGEGSTSGGAASSSS